MTLRHVPLETSTAYYDICTVHHEYDGHANHRLQVEGTVGDWASYADFAVITFKEVKFAATTEYWWPGLPEIFAIHPLKDHDISGVAGDITTKVLHETIDNIHQRTELTMAEKAKLKRIQRQNPQS